MEDPTTKEYPLFFESGGPIFGGGYVVSVVVRGRVLATWNEDDGEFVLSGVNPGSLIGQVPEPFTTALPPSETAEGSPLTRGETEELLEDLRTARRIMREYRKHGLRDTVSFTQFQADRLAAWR